MFVKMEERQSEAIKMKINEIRIKIANHRSSLARLDRELQKVLDSDPLHNSDFAPPMESNGELEDPIRERIQKKYTELEYLRRELESLLEEEKELTDLPK